MEIFAVCFENVDEDNPLTVSGTSGLGQCSRDVKELLKEKASRIKQGQNLRFGVSEHFAALKQKHKRDYLLQ